MATHLISNIPDPSGLLIVGMHRSGTSCLAGSLQQRGLYLGDVHEWNPHNLKGNRENQQVMDLNDEILEFNQGSWDTPPSTITWNIRHKEKRDLIISSLQDSKQIWGFKDPRTLITLGFWEDGLSQPFQLIGTYRHPYAVAASLHKRNGLPIESGLKLWYSYNNKLLNKWRATPFPLLCFDILPEKYLLHIEKACTYLGLPEKNTATPFFESELRSHSKQPVNFSGVHEKHLDLYESLQKAHHTFMS